MESEQGLQTVDLERTKAAVPIRLSEQDVSTLTGFAKTVVELERLKSLTTRLCLGTHMPALRMLGELAQGKKSTAEPVVLTVPDYQAQLFQLGVSYETWHDYVMSNPPLFKGVALHGRHLRVTYDPDIEQFVRTWLEHHIENKAKAHCDPGIQRGIRGIIRVMRRAIGLSDGHATTQVEVRRVRAMGTRRYTTFNLSKHVYNVQADQIKHGLTETKQGNWKLDGVAHIDGRDRDDATLGSARFVTSLGHSGTRYWPGHEHRLKRSHASSEDGWVLAHPDELVLDRSQDGLNHIINTNAVPHCAPSTYTPDWSQPRPADRYMLRLSCTGTGLLQLKPVNEHGAPAMRMRF